MDTESLQTLSAGVLGLGVIFAALGGFGLLYSVRSTRHMAESAAIDALRVKLAALQKSNEELRERLRLTEPEPGKQPAAAGAKEPEVKSPVSSAAGQLGPAPAGQPPAGWAGASFLEEMIEASIATENASQTPLSEKQHTTITRILGKYGGRTIAVHTVAGDDGGFQLAEALKAAFAEAGWRVEGIEQVPYANPPAGLFITSGAESSPEDAIIPHEALTTAGFQVSRCADSNLKGDKTVLLVGATPK